MALELYANVNVMEVGDTAGGDLTGTFPNPAVDFEGGYTVYDARYVEKAGDAMTGALWIHGGADELQLKVKGYASQSANLQEWQASAGTVLTKIASDGALTVGASADVRTYIGPAPNSNNYHYDLRYADTPATGGLMQLYMSKTEPAGGGGVYSGVNAVFDVVATTGIVASQFTGQQFFVTKAGAGEINYLWGTRERIEVAGGIANNVWGLETNVAATNGGTIANGYGVQVTGSKDGSSSFTNWYGLKIEDADFASTNSFSIYTGRGDVRLMTSGADKLGFHGASPVAQQTVTGSRGGNAALASLLTKLANVGLIVDSST